MGSKLVVLQGKSHGVECEMRDEKDDVKRLVTL